MDADTTEENPADRPIERLPALIIGVGGTGLAVLKFIKAMADEGVDHDLSEALKKSRIVLLGIDSDRLANDKEDVDQAIYATTDGRLSDRLAHVKELPPVDEFFPIDAAAMVQAAERIEADALRRADAIDAKDEPKLTYPAFDRWYPYSAGEDTRISMASARSGGAQQWRPLGRLGIARQAGELSEKLRGLIAEVRAHHQHQSAEGSILVVSSIAGGTGSGMFLDIAMLIRMIETEMAVRGVFVLPDVFDGAPATDRIYSNGYAALMELSSYANWAGVDRDFVVDYPGLGEFRATPTSPPLFDAVHLYGAFRPRDSTSLDPVRRRIQATAFRVSQNIVTWLRRDVRAASRFVAQNGRTPAVRDADIEERRSVFSTSATTLFPYVDPRRMASVVGERLARVFEIELDRKRLELTVENLTEWKLDAESHADLQALPAVFALPITEDLRDRKMADDRFMPTRIAKVVATLRAHAAGAGSKVQTLVDVERAFDDLVQSVGADLPGNPEALRRLCQGLAAVAWVNREEAGDGRDVRRQVEEIKALLDAFVVPPEADTRNEVVGPTAAHGYDLERAHESMVKTLEKIETALPGAILSLETEECIRNSVKALSENRPPRTGGVAPDLQPVPAVWWLAEHNRPRKSTLAFRISSLEAAPGFENSQYQDLVKGLADLLEKNYAATRKEFAELGCSWLALNGRGKKLQKRLEAILRNNERNKLLLTWFQEALRTARKESAQITVPELAAMPGRQRLNLYSRFFENVVELLRDGQTAIASAQAQVAREDVRKLAALHHHITGHATGRLDPLDGTVAELTERARRDLVTTWQRVLEDYGRTPDANPEETIRLRLRRSLRPLFAVEGSTILRRLHWIDVTRPSANGTEGGADQEEMRRSRSEQQMHSDRRWALLRESLHQLAFDTARLFVGIWVADQFLMRARYRGHADSLRKLVQDGRSDVFREGRALSTVTRRHLVVVPPPDLGKDERNRTAIKQMREELRHAAQSEMNVTPSFADASSLPLVFHEDLYHPGADIQLVRRLHDSYMSRTPSERRLYHIRRQDAGHLTQLISPYHLDTPVYCGNAGCHRNISSLRRDATICPGCEKPIWNRCGNEKCTSDDVQRLLTKSAPLKGAKEKTWLCPACGDPLHTYWWHCSEATHETFTIAMDKDHCPHCVAEQRDGRRRPSRVSKRPTSGKLRCDGCGSYGDPSTDIPAALTPFYRKGVNGQARLTFDPEVAAAKRDRHICANRHPRLHFTFPTCPRDAHDRHKRHHVYLFDRSTGRRWQCGQHPDIVFHECGECGYPVEYGPDDIKAGKRVECPRCLRTLSYCFSCSERDHRLFVPKSDAACDEGTCPRCFNPMARNPTLREGATLIATNRCFCPNVFGCAAGADPWHRQTDDRELSCEACVHEPRGTLMPSASLVPTIGDCDMCKILIGAGEWSTDPAVKETPPPLRVTEVEPDAPATTTKTDSALGPCPICSFHRSKTKETIKRLRSEAKSNDDLQPLNDMLEMLKHLTRSRDNAVVRDSLIKFDIAKTKAAFATIQAMVEQLFDHTHPTGDVLCKRLRGVAAEFDRRSLPRGTHD